MPKTYVSSVSLLVDRRDEQQLAGASGLPPRQQQGYLQTQSDIITSHRVSKKVAQNLKLAERPEYQEAFARNTDGTGNIEDWIGSVLQKQLRVDTSQSSMIQIYFKAGDPQQAADTANAYAKAYTETALELRTEPTRDAAAWFDEQVKELRAGLEKSQARLSAYQKERGIFANDERFDLENLRLGELSTQLVQAQNANYEASARRRHAQEFMGRGATLESLPEVLAHPFIHGLKSELLRGEARLNELSSHLGPNHPAYQRQVTEVTGLREKLNGEMRKIVAGVESAARQSSEREEALKAAIAAQRAQVMALKEHRNEVAVLARDVETQQRIYDSAMQRYAVNKIDSQARQTNVATLNAAVAPNQPLHPKFALNFLLALVVGTMLGLGTVYAAETVDPVVRSRGDLESQLNLPLIGVLDDGQSSAGRRLLPAPRHQALPSPS
jgi:chain length determinant protein EpsF